MHSSFPDHESMHTARARYFEENDFGPNGGYEEAWVDFSLGPLPLPFPNTAARVEAVRYHDLHHIITRYRTDVTGEFEISAWELGAGCGRYAAAWALNLGGIAGGLFLAPGRVFRAFARGRRSRSLYGEPFEPWLERSVGEARAWSLGEDAEGARATPADALFFAAAVATGLAVGLALAVCLIPLAPVGVWLGLRRSAE